MQFPFLSLKRLALLLVALGLGGTALAQAAAQPAAAGTAAKPEPQATRNPAGTPPKQG